MFRITAIEKLVLTFIAFILVMIVLRIYYSGSIRYIFLLWNIFLAWVPFKISIYFNGVSKKIFLLLVIVWLIFFPNALYILTDLIHLKGETNVPIWYDAVLLFASSLIGLLMAFISLFNVEKYIRSRINVEYSGVMISVFIFMGAFGVYIGRFLRWNSWDILTNPFSLFFEIAVRFTQPMLHYRTWGVTLLLASFFYLLYFTSKRLTKIYIQKKSR
jgi:uncharacterized membrane protein